MKQFLLSITFMLLVLGLSAQTDTATVQPIHWKKNFSTGFNINQSNFSQNWKGGGVSSYALGWFMNHLASYDGPVWSFNSDLQMQLGFLQNNGDKTKKTSDRIFYDFKAGKKISKHWNFFASVNFLTQFMEGYDYKKTSVLDITKDSLISTFFAPAYLTSSVGLEYKPVDYLWMRFGVGTLRQTFVLDNRISQAQLYGLDHPGDKLRNQAVLQYIVNFDKSLTKNVSLKWRYMVNFDYFRSNDGPKAFVHMFNANLTLKATKYISTNLQVNVISDHDQDENIQFSQVLALGFIYQLQKP